jgi:Protein of unknown function (DUF2946)
MTFSRSLRRFAALAAVFAVTLQALWPLLSHARPNELSLLAPLCTVDGVTHYLEIKAGKTTPLDQRSAQHGEHCKLCLLGGDEDVAIVAPHAILAVALVSRELKLRNLAVSSPESANHPSAQPRAPPTFS